MGAWLGALWSVVVFAILASLNLIGLLTFLFFFGVAGLILQSASQVSPLLIVVLPTFAGVAMALTVGVTLHRLYAQTPGELTSENSRLEGRLGRVSVAIRAGGVGEVIVAPPATGPQSISARCLNGTAISEDAVVVIVQVRAGIAEVVPAQSAAAYLGGRSHRRTHGGAAPHA